MWQAKKKTLLRPEDIAALESLEEGSSGYYGKMADYLDQFIAHGVAEGRFSEAEAQADLEIALWYSYAYNNMDTYESYYAVVNWMIHSEAEAAGCGMWYYRYAVALMYCGRLEQALIYAERGVQEEPAYPWGWLTTAKLRSHFGDTEGALQAVARGLALVPGDYEFTTLQQEIEQGASLEQMVFHYIYADDDKTLQQEGRDSDKWVSVVGLVCDQQNLAEIKYGLQLTDWQADTPYCSGQIPFQGQNVNMIFQMNEAAVSKLSLDWLQEQLRLVSQENASLQERLAAEGYGDCYLDAILVRRNHTTALVYYNPKTDEAVTLHQEAEEQILPPDAAYPDLVKLYCRQEDGLQYAECWYDGELITEHVGRVGQTGEVRKQECDSAEVYQQHVAQFYQDYVQLGYEPWSEEATAWVVVQFLLSVQNEPFVPDDAAQNLLDQARMQLNDGLGWNGLGHVERWEMGPTQADGSRFVLNLYCVTVDANLALGVILQVLEQALDCSQLKLAVRQAGAEEYTLAYAADCSEDFSL